MRLNNAVFGIVFIAASVAIVFEAQSFPTIPGQPYGSAFFPRLLGFGFGIVGTILVIQGGQSRASVPWATWPAWARNPLSLTRFVAVPLALVAYILLSDPLGFAITSMVILIALQLLLHVRPIPALAAAIVVTVVIEMVFVLLLRVPLPQGPLESLFF